MKHITTKNLPAVTLTAGEQILLSGDIYTARDAVHMRLCELLDSDLPLPVNLDGAVLYYAGPAPMPPGHIIGSCGPTTAERMDRYTPQLLRQGVIATIGKGARGQQVIDAIAETKSVYFCAVGGAGALLASCVTACEVIAFAELGCEAIHKLTVKNMPLVVGVDKTGNSILSKRPQMA